MIEGGVRLSDTALEGLLQQYNSYVSSGSAKELAFYEYLWQEKKYDLLARGLPNSPLIRARIYAEMSASYDKNAYVQAILENKGTPALLKDFINNSHFPWFCRHISSQNKKDMIEVLVQRKDYENLNTVFETMLDYKDAEGSSNRKILNTQIKEMKEMLKTHLEETMKDKDHNFASLRLHHYVLGKAHPRESELVASSASYWHWMKSCVVGYSDPKPPEKGSSWFSWG